MADKTVYVQPVGDDTGDHYHTLAAAIAGELIDNADLTAGGMDGILYIIIRNGTGSWSGAPDTTAVDVDGFTTDVDHYVNITCDSTCRHSGKWDTTKYLIQTTAVPLTITDSFTRLDGIQLECNYSTSDSNRKCLYVHVPTCRVSHTICKWSGTGIGVNDGLVVDAAVAAAKSLVWDCIVFGTTDNGYKLTGENNSIDCWNCTAVDCGVGFYSGYLDANLSMCLASDCTDCFTEGDFNAADHCAYTQGTDPGANGHDVDRGTEFAFVNYAGDDFHLTASFNGTTDPSGGIVTDDIDYVARAATFDIGADEYVAAGGGSIVPQAMMYYQQLEMSG